MFLGWEQESANLHKMRQVLGGVRLNLSFVFRQPDGFVHGLGEKERLPEMTVLRFSLFTGWLPEKYHKLILYHIIRHCYKKCRASCPS